MAWTWGWVSLQGCDLGIKISLDCTPWRPMINRMVLSWVREIRLGHQVWGQDGGVEKPELTFSHKNIKIKTTCRTTFSKKYLNLPKMIFFFQRQRRSHNEMVGEVHLWNNHILYPPSGWPTTWRTMISKKSLHCCEGSWPHIRLPSLEMQPRDWECPGNLTLKASGIWL